MSSKKVDPARATMRDELERDVEKMRALGVLVWNGITLGPAPQQPERAMTEEEVAEMQERRARKEYEIMFAASSTRPKLSPRPTMRRTG